MILLVFPNEREYNFTARWKLKNKVQKANSLFTAKRVNNPERKFKGNSDNSKRTIGIMKDIIQKFKRTRA